MINIIQKGTSTVRATAEKLQYSGTFMEIPQLAVTVKSPTKIAWEIGDFITWGYDGATYVLKELPQEMKQSTSGTYGEAFVYENIRFIAPQGDLKYVDFLDVVKTGSTSNFSTLPTFSFYGDCYDFIDRINANIGRLYANWEIKAADVESGDIFDALNLERNVEITSPIKVWDALGLFYSMWGLGFVYSYDTVNAKHNITIGATGGVTGNFSYGQGNGLYMVSKNIAKEDAIVTRLRPYGSTRNMPSRYYNNKIDFTNELIYLPNLMIPYSKWAAQNRDPKDAYINSNNPAVGSGDTSYDKYGIREASVYFDGTNNLPEIYPTISKITAAEVRAAITAYGAGEQAALYKSPNSAIYPDATRMDKIKVGDVIEDDGVILTTNAYSETATFIGDVGLQPTNTKSNILKFDPIYFATLMNEGEYNIVFSEQTITASSIGTGDLAIINDSILRLWIIRNGIRTTLISDISGTQVSEYIVTFTLPELSINVTEGGDGYSIEMEMEINFSDLDAGQDVSISWERDSGTATYSLAKVVPNREFTLKLKQVGFDIFRFLSSAGQRPVLSMIDGACGGREFIIKKADYNAATDDWSLICARQADTSLNNQWFPNANFHIAAEDTFVLLNINMPDIYITIAEERLFTEACKWLAKAKEPQWVYEPKIDEIYMAHNPQVIKEGMMMPLTDDDLAISGNKTINTVTITENEGAVRTFDVVLREDTDKDLLKYINDAAKNQSSSAVRGITNATTDKTESAENGTTPSTSLSYTAENVVNKVSIINENSTAQQYVNAKALYDKFASFGTEYIKNQIASEQTADYWISGKAKAGTLILPQSAPTLDSGEVGIYSLNSGFSGELPSGAGSVTSISMVVPTGLSVTPATITESGTFTISYASGYSIPTNTKQSEWTSAYNDKINSATFTASTLTLTQQDGGTIAVSVPTFNQNTTGSAATLTTPRAINVSVSGVSGTAQNFNGSAAITIPVTLTTLTRGNYLTGNNYNGGTATTWAVDATTTATANKVVARDANADIFVRDINASRKVKGATLILPQSAPTLSSGEVGIYSLDSGFSGELPSGSGSVTSIALTMPTGFSVSGSPITQSGTFGVTFASGYFLPTTTQFATKADVSLIGAANGIAPLDSGGKIALQYLPSTLLKYMGVWNASTNTPTLLATDVNRKGQVWNVSVAGTQFGISFKLGDWLIYNDSGVAEKSDNSDDVTSVNGYTGAVTLKTSDIAEQTNLYYTNARVKTYADTLYTPLAHASATNNPHSVTAAQVGALALSGGTLTGDLTLSKSSLFDDNFLRFVNNTQLCRIGIRNPYANYGLTFVDPSTNYYKIWHEGNSNSSSFNWSAAKLTSTTLLLPQVVPTLTSGEMAIYGLESGFSGETPSGAGSVTSISMVVPTGLSVTPATITESGTFTISYASGYSIPTNNKQGDWDSAYALRHNAVTLGTANGLSLSTQELSLGLASASANGALSSTDWSTFNGKQAKLTGTGASSLVRVNTSGVIAYDDNTYLTGNQTITLSGIVTGSGTTAITTAIADSALSIAKTNGLQSALDAKMATASYPDLTAIEALSGTSGFLKKTAANTWALDTNSYALISGATTQDFQVKALTMNGALSGATTGSFSGNVSAASFTSGGNAVLHAGNYSSYALPLSGGTLSNTSSISALTLYTGSANNDNFINFSNDGQSVKLGVRNPYSRFGLTLVTPSNEYYRIIHEGNIGSQSVNYATSAGNADTLDNQHASYFATAAQMNATNLSIGYLPYWNGSSLVNSVISTDGTNVNLGSGKATMTENINTNLRIPKVAPTSPTSGQYYFYIVE